MIENITGSPLFGLLITLMIYIPAYRLYRRTGKALLNPFLVSFVLMIVILKSFGISVDDYMMGGRYIIALLPVTIILLALPLYRQLPLLLEHRMPILMGIASGVLTSASSVFILSRLFGIDDVLIRSILPKSITTPLGLILSDTLGGLASLTVIAIVLTGLMGVLIYIPVFRLLGIRHPVAQGIAIGTASHAIGTAKALELGEVQGAMSGLAIVLAGVLTVVLAPLFLLVFAWM